MGSVLRKYWFLTLVSLLFFASTGLAQQDTITFENGGVYPGVGPAYVNPYSGLVNGVSTPMICDDWADEVYVGETWTANVTNITSLGSSTQNPPYFTNTNASAYSTLAGIKLGPLTQGQLYDAVANLGSEMLALPSGDTSDQTALSYAIWELTCATTGASCADQPFNAIYGTSFFSTASADLSAAVTQAESNNPFNAAGWEILTPTGPGTCSGGAPGGCGEPQEFLVYAPESSPGILLGADMIGLLGLVFLFRRRLLRPIQ
jgi:hypothetical protein